VRHRTSLRMINNETAGIKSTNKIKLTSRITMRSYEGCLQTQQFLPRGAKPVAVIGVAHASSLMKTYLPGHRARVRRC